MIIKRLMKNNERLHEDLKILRIVWLKRMIKSEKTYSSLIIKIIIKMMINHLLNVSMLNLYQKCTCKLFEKNCCITQCFRYFEFDHMIKFCKKEQRCDKCADKHHIKECVVFLNKRRYINCNESYEFWRCTCFKWQQQMKQSSEIYRNRLTRYFEMSRYSCILLILSLNSLSLMISLSSMNSSNSMNLSSSINVTTKINSWNVDESMWQMIEIKKRWVECFSCMISDSEEMIFEQAQKQQIRKCKRLSMTESIQKAVSAQSQQQL